MRSLRKILSLAMAWLMIFSVISVELGVTVSAKESMSGEITGFEAFDINENALNLTIGEKPSMEELKALMPDTLGVYLNGGTEAVYIAVDWFCVGEDYEKCDNFYFQFSPMWDEDRYTLSEEIDLLTEAPYIAVFFRSRQSGISTFAVTNNSNEAIIFKYLTETLGYNTAAACGAMANIFCESSFIPNNLQDAYEKKLGYTDSTYTAAVDNGTYTNFVKDAAGYGLCQWTYYTRKQGLLDLAKSKKVSIGNITMQLEYLGIELAACATGRYMKAISNTADGAYDVGYYYCTNFERPAQTGDQKSVYRGNLAKNTYWAEYGVTHTHKWDAEPTIDTPATCIESGSQSIHCATCSEKKDVTEIPAAGHSFGEWTEIKAPTYTEVGQEERVCGICEVSETRDVEMLKRPVVTEVFADVSENEWYIDAVQYAYDHGLMSGNNGLFNPGGKVTRAQVVMTLYRLAGSPEVTDYAACEKFADVANGEWYTSAVCWACKEGIGKGNDATGMFQTNDYVTRQQLATFLYRYAAYAGYDMNAETDFSGMVNADKVSTYAESAVKWAVASELISGSERIDEMGNIVYDLNPTGTATRAQLATILQRFCGMSE